MLSIGTTTPWPSWTPEWLQALALEPWYPMAVTAAAVLLALSALLFLLLWQWARSSAIRRKRETEGAQQALKTSQQERRQSTKEADEAVRRAEKAAEDARQANEAKSVFLAAMSHEIRTPLNSILGLTDVLLTSQIDEEQQDHLQTIKNSGEALLAIIGNILDYSKIESGKLELKHEQFDLGDLFQDLRNLFNLQARQKKLGFRCELDSDASLLVLTDRNHLRQVLVNLLGNALKFTEEGEVVCFGRRERIRDDQEDTENKRHRYRIEIEVTDTGAGVPEDKVNRLFQPFQQLAELGTQRYGGSGLGLTICKRIIDAMGGEIGYRPNDPRGSVFSIRLEVEGVSLRANTRSGLTLSGEKLYKSALAKSFYSHRILVADDNALNRRVMKAVLEKMGHRVLFAVNGEDAIEKLRLEGADLVLMDIQMPVMDGLEATRAIREGRAGNARKGIPIIALTAYAMTSDREKCLSNGMDHYITKPLKPEDLRDILTQIAREREKLPIAQD